MLYMSKFVDLFQCDRRKGWPRSSGKLAFAYFGLRIKGLWNGSKLMIKKHALGLRRALSLKIVSAGPDPV